jgi:DNA repair photolyase
MIGGEQTANHAMAESPRTTFPLFLDFARPSLTTRDIATAVRNGGAAALTQAERRADDARYQEVTCRSALNPVRGMPFKWTLNAYRGCTHGCHYCFARRYHSQFELNSDDEFASVILVKRNIAEVLRKELDRPAWNRELVAVGTATDPYQPIEGHYQLTRRCLDAMVAGRTPISLVTKGPMVVRDRDVLLELGRASGATVCMSVPTVDEEAWRILEPGTAPPLQRLRAVRALVDAGVDAGVLMAPIVPGFSTSRAKLERTVKAIADHGARFVGCNVMYLQDGTRTHFMKFLDREFPSMRPRYDRLYRKKYPPGAYRDELRGMVRMLQQRYGLEPRRKANETAANKAESNNPEAGTDADRRAGLEDFRGPEQVGFAW